MHVIMNPFPVAPVRRQPVARPKFGIREIGSDQYEQAKQLYEGGMAMARLGRGDEAERLLLQAFRKYDASGLRLYVARAFAEGVEPGLAANPKKADQLLQEILGGGGYIDSVAEYVAATIYEKLAEREPKYAEKAADIYLTVAKRCNLHGMQSAARKLLKLNKTDAVKELFLKQFESASGHFNDSKAYGAFDDGLAIVKILAGIPQEKEKAADPEWRPLRDASLAKQLLQRLIRKEAPKHVLLETLSILTFGKGDLTQDKALAKTVIDRVQDAPIVKDAWEQ